MSSSPAANKPAPASVVVLTDGSKDEIRQQAKQLLDRVVDLVQVQKIDTEFASDAADWSCDFVLVLGGDGSILRAVRQMDRSQRPILGVNLGKLGFLADVPPEQMEAALAAVNEGRFRTVEHLMFECTLLRQGKVVCDVLGLNEVGIFAGPPFAILELQLYVDAELVTTYSCDGLIVATPVGSTAHSLSAGGPILRKNLQAFVICPVSPHTLTNRPVVDSAERVYELVVPQPHDGTSLVVDGQVVSQLQPGDRVRIVSAPTTFQLIEVEGNAYYRTLREKLGWGGRLKNC